MSRFTSFIFSAVLLSFSTGCHVYHVTKFALQDRHPSAEEALLLLNAPANIENATLESTGKLERYHAGKKQFGTVKVYSDGTDTFI